MVAPNEGYLTWLISQTGPPSTRRRHMLYWKLLHQLHMIPFRWFVHNDDNRGQDGLELRDEYLDEFGIHDDDAFMEAPASVLEVFIALSRRASFESDGTPAQWFWQFVENLGLRHYTDRNYNAHTEEEVDEAINKLLDRSYSPDGVGGLFPLRAPKHDQRRIELYFQLGSYILEREYGA